MMTKPKKDSSICHVIVDLSMPQGASVNSGIPKNSLDGAPVKLWLSNPATLANKISEYRKGCLLYKVDLTRAYRQLRTDPLDWPFLMLQWEDQFFLDISIPFGLRHKASACQRTTEAVSAIAREEAGADTAPYIAPISLGPDTRADIIWFTSFLGQFNGVTLIKPSVAQHVIHVDSCLQGGGSLCSGLQYYKILYPDYLQSVGLKCGTSYVQLGCGSPP